MELQPIGRVHSPVTEGTDAGWGAVESEIHLRPELAAGLRGLEQFSHALVLFVMHATPAFDPARDLVRSPRGRADLPELGIFAQRARHRPNPIGLTAVAILGLAGPVVRVRGLDAIDGSPVLDLKPYFPVFDRVEAAATPEWVARLMRGYL
jgi:tRNA-Thr(GGU) m(6)t(6)A37 methyltransferase TsaA